MSQSAQCERCGGKDFRLESGFYFCSECQLQSQDIQEHVLEGFYGGTAIQSRKVKKTEDEKEASAQQGTSSGGKKYVSSVELLNYVLKKLVDELILLGAPKQLKIITLQLWASYLRKLELAFTSTTVQKKPKVGVWYKQGDVARFYKVRKPMSVRDYPKLVKRTRIAKSKKTVSTDGSETTRSKKRRLTASKASLARAEYEESCVEGSINLSSQAPSVASLDLSLGSQSSFASGGEKIKYSKHGREDLKIFMDQINKPGDKMKIHTKAGRRSRSSIYNPRAMQIIVILRIALILSGSDIHIGDLLRWSEEGYFSYTCMKKLLPPEIEMTQEQPSLFTTAPHSIFIICRATSAMVKFLSVLNAGISPSTLISNLVKRYCKMLNLPDNLSIGIDELLKIRPPKLWLDSTSCNYEGRAMAFILFSLKILIGLDDVTEYTYVPRKDVEGVKWEDWCCQYEPRLAKKALHHHPTLVRHYPDSYIGRNHAFLSHWDGDPSHGNAKNTKNDLLLMECYKNVLKPLACKLPEPSWRPGLEHETKPSGPPLAVLSECIDGSVRKGERNIILEPTVKIKRREAVPDNARELNVRILDDDAEVREKTTLKINKSDSTGVKKVTENEDYSVWMNHTMTLAKCRVDWRTFDYTSPGKFPHSFWWLLRQMAGVVHQNPLNIYHELVKLEKVYSCRTQKLPFPFVW